MARHGWLLGFAVTVVDARDAYLQPDRFAGARLVSTPFDRLSDGAPVPAGAFVVVMNHHLERDRLALGHALESDALYVGVLGPRARFKRLMAALAVDGCSPSGDALARVHSPAGLSLGAETPEEVAVSILSEIVAVRRGFSGGFLSGRDPSLHRAPAQRTVARS